ncbi:MAG TPA: peptide-N4-asparagine amidase [Frateuria sp.]|uniref:peptide-N4-asparagine amidase n=1 Tax=Frateuria sp. TaxID=2211372 RepID=UPI002D7E823C|nr:peptide-N4-asparagine amidase [Frateuria sp.]HET6806361.1 peptide-N4-asparagine amidase [Frateuria sp.]
MPVRTVDPRVPVAAGQPCVVQLIRNRIFPQQDLGAGPPIDASFTFMPPPACPRPWSKVILKADITSTRRSIVDTLGLNLGGITVFHGGVPRFDGVRRWHVERDLTDYSALFGSPHNGKMWTVTYDDAIDFGVGTPAFSGTATVTFYPATARIPAPRVPDAVVAIDGQTARNLPHNVVRAYLDVENTQPWWFTCVPDRLAARYALIDIYAPGENPREGFAPSGQGCGGSSFRELVVAVDGTPAGIAPMFPWLSPDLSAFLPNSVNEPIPTPQLLNFVPYRVDLTPFAAVLSDAGPHRIGAAGTLLLYLDHGRASVTGAVTTNTLAGSSAAPTWTNTLTRTDETTRGRIVTHQQRRFEIRGFVNTSRGRIETRLTQASRFDNTQVFHLEGPQQITAEFTDKLYVQNLDLASTTTRTVRQFIGGTLVSRDDLQVSYPLQLAYRLPATLEVTDGWYTTVKGGSVVAHQQLLQDTDDYRIGEGHYVTHVRRNFSGSRTQTTFEPDTNWSSRASHRYTDSFGSCYRAALGASNGSIQSSSKGIGCPGDQNRVRWFAHPDGSANSLGWWR